MDSKPSGKHLIAPFFLFLWLGALMGGYFWAHKPFDFGVMGALLPAVLNLVLVGGVLFLCAAVGRWLTAPIMGTDDPATHLALSAGLGLGAVSVLWGLIGLAGGIHPLTGWLMVLVLGGVGYRQMKPTWQALRSLQRPQPSNGLQKFIWLYGLMVLALTLLVALAPVTAWDALTYHLTGPRLFIEAGRIVHPLDIPQMGFPLLGQMQFMWGMLLVGGDGPAALFHFGYGLLALAVTVGLARRSFGPEVAWLAAMVFLSVPSLLYGLSWPYVDGALLFYTTAAFYAFLRWQETRSEWEGMIWLGLMGAFCGFAGGVKYTAVAVPLALALSMGLVSWREGAVTLIKRLSLLGVIALGLVLPWLVINALVLHNPVYPFFFTDGLFWNAWRAHWYDLPGTGMLANGPIRLLLAPFEVTIIGSEESELYNATVGPFIFGLLFLLPVIWGKLSAAERRLTTHMLIFFGVNYLLWLAGLARSALLLQGRLIFLVFGVTAVLGGLALERIREFQRPDLNIVWLSRAILSITLFFLLFGYALYFLKINPVPVLLGLESKEAYSVRQLGVYPEVIAKVNELPATAKVVFLWETRSYACQVVCDPDPILDRWQNLTENEGLTAVAIAQKWREAGYTHVLLNQAGLDFLLEAAKGAPIGPSIIGTTITANDMAVLADLKAEELTATADWSNAYILYEIK